MSRRDRTPSHDQRDPSLYGRRGQIGVHAAEAENRAAYRFPTSDWIRGAIVRDIEFHGFTPPRTESPVDSFVRRWREIALIPSGDMAVYMDEQGVPQFSYRPGDRGFRPMRWQPSWVRVQMEQDFRTRTMRYHVTVTLPDDLHHDLTDLTSEAMASLSVPEQLEFMQRMLRGQPTHSGTGSARTRYAMPSEAPLPAAPAYGAYAAYRDAPAMLAPRPTNVLGVRRDRELDFDESTP